MGNLSYCRFENTLRDLSDCEDALFEKGLEGLSEAELEAAKRLIELCADIVSSHIYLLEGD